MPDDFNPYHKWLGIPLHQQPANHYRLLGLEQGECDPDVIAHAAEQRVLYLKSVSGGEHGHLSRLLLDEISRACNCLLDAEQKTAYDKLMQTKQHASQFPGPPPLHSPAPAERIPEDKRFDRVDDIAPHHPFSDDDSSPLAINIGIGNAQKKKKNWDLEANKNKNWEDLNDQLDDLPEKRSSTPDFTGISATGSAEQISPPELFSAESLADESTYIEPANTPALPSSLTEQRPEQKLEESPAISQTTENAESFPAPPPLPPEKKLVNASFEQQNPFAIAGDSEGELVNGVSFSNAQSIGTPEPKSDLAKSTRKKEKRIQLIGHLVAPIIGLIIGWIILQYLKTK